MPFNLSDVSWRTLAAVLLGLILIAAGLAYGLTRVKRPLGYSNQVPVVAPAAEIPPGARACQPDEAVPADAPSSGVVIADRRGPGGRLEFTVRAEGRTVVSSTVRVKRPPNGYVVFPLPGRNPEVPLAAVCVRNRGPRSVALLGEPQARGPDATPVLPGYGFVPEVNGQPQPGRFRIDYGGPEAQTVLARLPEMMRRAGLVKGAFVDTWTIWLAFSIALALAGFALRSVLRVEGP